MSKLKTYYLVMALSRWEHCLAGTHPLQADDGSVGMVPVYPTKKAARTAWGKKYRLVPITIPVDSL